jgi:hypothetical protein
MNNSSTTNNNGSAQSDGSGNSTSDGSGNSTSDGSGNATSDGSGNSTNTGSGSGNSTNTGSSSSSSSSSSLSLEELTMEYKMTLMMYNKVQSDYINYLKDVNDGSDYTIVGVGTDGHLWSSAGIDGGWAPTNDGGAGITGICTGNDGKTILVCGYDQQIYTKTSWDSPPYTLAPGWSCCITKIAQGSDGTVVGIGMDNTLYAKVGGISADWTHVNSAGEWVSAVCIAPDDSVYVIGAYTGSDGYGIYKKKSYKTLASESWELITSQFFIDISIMTNGTMIGVGTDNNLYTYASYKHIRDTSKRVGHGKCCVISVTSVLTPKYAHFKGKTFWGADSLFDSSANTMQSCQALCSATSGCSGATFNSTNSPDTTCQLRSGDGDISMGRHGDYAFMVEGPGLLKMSQQLNSKLADLNNQIFNLTTNSGASLKNPAGKHNAKKLMVEAHKLKKERAKLALLSGESTGLDEAQEEGDLMINSNYYSFMLLSLLAVVFVIGLIVLLTPKSGSGSTSSAAPAPAPAAAPAVQSGGKLKKNVLFFVLFGAMIAGLSFFAKKHVTN